MLEFPFWYLLALNRRNTNEILSSNLSKSLIKRLRNNLKTVAILITIGAISINI